MSLSLCFGCDGAWRACALKCHPLFSSKNQTKCIPNCILYKTGVFYYNIVNTVRRDGTILSGHIRKPQSGKDDNAVVGGISIILARIGSSPECEMDPSSPPKDTVKHAS